MRSRLTGKRGERGVALFLVLGILLVVVALANVVLVVMLSETRFTYHKASRVRALYAARAGMVYALAQLSSGAWSGPQDYCIQPVAGSSCRRESGGNVPNPRRVIDPDIPFPVVIELENTPTGVQNTMNVTTYVEYPYQ